MAGIANSQTDNQTTRDCHVGKSDKRLSALTMEKSIYNHKKKTKRECHVEKKDQRLLNFLLIITQKGIANNEDVLSVAKSKF